MKTLNKFMQLVGKVDFEVKDLDLVDIINFISSLDDVDSLCELQSMILAVQVVLERCDKHNIDIHSVINKQFNRVTE